MNIENKIIITAEESGLRLDKFLVEKIKDCSRSFWQKAINDNLVLVNKKEVTPHYKIKEGDEIEILKRKVEKVIEEKKIDLSPDKNIKFDIVFENDNFLVINKPPGLTVHPSDGTPKGTLANGLLDKYPQLKDVGEDELRPGIVHRLDKDVSGLMVVAKNQKMFLHLKEQFKNREVKKEYLTLVYGVINKDYDEINLTIGRSKTTGIMATGGENYKKAKTLFWVKKRFRNYTYLKVKILTGRTHQIRVHLRAVDHPVVGDKMYYLKKYNNIKDFGLNRNFLHSYKLGFKNLEGEWVEFKEDLPDNLNNILKEIDIVYE